MPREDRSSTPLRWRRVRTMRGMPWLSRSRGRTIPWRRIRDRSSSGCVAMLRYVVLYQHLPTISNITWGGRSRLIEGVGWSGAVELEQGGEALNLVGGQQPLQVGQQRRRRPSPGQSLLHLLDVLLREPYLFPDGLGTLRRQVLESTHGEEVDVVPELEEHVLQAFGSPVRDPGADGSRPRLQPLLYQLRLIVNDATGRVE